MQELVISANTITKFNIPTDTFYHKIDGYTRNMNVTVKLLGVPDDLCWFRFNIVSQTYLFLPTHKESLIFRITATSSCQKSVSENLKVRIIKKLHHACLTSSVQFSVRQSTLLCTAEIVYKFLKRWRQYYQSASINAIRILSYERQLDGDYLVKFSLADHFCFACDPASVSVFTNKFVSNGIFNPNFVNIMEPDHIIKEISFTLPEKCSRTTTSTLTSM